MNGEEEKLSYSYNNIYTFSRFGNEKTINHSSHIVTRAILYFTLNKSNVRKRFLSICNYFLTTYTRNVDNWLSRVFINIYAIHAFIRLLKTMQFFHFFFFLSPNRQRKFVPIKFVLIFISFSRRNYDNNYNNYDNIPQYVRSTAREHCVIWHTR